MGKARDVVEVVAGMKAHAYLNEVDARNKIVLFE